MMSTSNWAANPVLTWVPWLNEILKRWTGFARQTGQFVSVNLKPRWAGLVDIASTQPLAPQDGKNWQVDSEQNTLTYTDRIGWGVNTHSNKGPSNCNSATRQPSNQPRKQQPMNRPKPTRAARQNCCADSRWHDGSKAHPDAHRSSSCEGWSRTCPKLSENPSKGSGNSWNPLESLIYSLSYLFLI